MSNGFSAYQGDDLFKKFKLKHHRCQSLSPRDHQCAVCDDRASGVHYGSQTCEGCKGFFKRTIQKRKNYQCHNYNQCVINKLQRNRCQACRFRKCLAQGMLIEAVRFERMKSNSIDEMKYLFEDQSFEQLFDHIRIAIGSNRILTEESIKKISWLLIETFMSWYRMLPFYSDYDDRFHQIILKNQWTSFSVLMLCYFIQKSKRKISFDKIRQQTNSSFSKTILDRFLQFFSQFIQIDRTKTELIFLSIILICQADQSKKSNLKDNYLKLIHTYELQTFPHERSARCAWLTNLSRQIPCITDILFQNQHFHLVFLLLSD